MTGGVGASVAGSPGDVRAEVAELLGVSADFVDPGADLTGRRFVSSLLLPGSEAAQ